MAAINEINEKNLRVDFAYDQLLYGATRPKIKKAIVNKWGVSAVTAYHDIKRAELLRKRKVWVKKPREKALKDIENMLLDNLRAAQASGDEKVALDTIKELAKHWGVDEPDKLQVETKGGITINWQD